MSSACTPSLVGIASPVLELNFPFKPWIIVHGGQKIQSNRVDSPVMRQFKFDRFEINALKLQAVSHNTTHLIIPASTLVLAQTLTSVTISQGSF